MDVVNLTFQCSGVSYNKTIKAVLPELEEAMFFADGIISQFLQETISFILFYLLSYFG